MIGLHCQLDWIWGHLGDALWGVTNGAIPRGGAAKAQPYSAGWGSGLREPAGYQQSLFSAS